MPTVKKTKAKKNISPVNKLTDITLLIDESGSMNSRRQEVVDGCNRFIQEQQAISCPVAVLDEDDPIANLTKEKPSKAKKSDKTPARLSLIKFMGNRKVIYSGVDILNAKPLGLADYIPSGSTAYYDSLCETIDETEKRLNALPKAKRPSQVIIVTFTDGHNTDRKLYGLEHVRERITKFQDKHNWKFLFLGANIDSAQAGADMGLRVGTMANYSTQHEGTQAQCYFATSNAIGDLRQTGAMRSLQSYVDKAGANK